MAIIKCPECGENVSTTAQKCVHCGCEITYCPECNQVFTGNIKVCPSCGYHIAPEETESKTHDDTKGFAHVNNEKLQEDLNNNDILASFNESTLFRVIVCKYGFLFKLAFAVVSIATLVTAIIKIFSFSITTEDMSKRAMQALSGLFSGNLSVGLSNEQYIQGWATEFLKPISSLITTSAIFSMLAFLFTSIRKNYIKMTLGKWITKNDLDVVAAVKRDSYNNAMDYFSDLYTSPFKTFSRMDGLRAIQDAAIYNDTKEKMQKTIIVNAIVRLILFTLFVIFTSLSLTNIAETRIITLIANAASGKDNPVVYEFTYPIITGVILVIWIFAEACFLTKKENELFHVWQENNLPDEFRTKNWK